MAARNRHPFKHRGILQRRPHTARSIRPPGLSNPRRFGYEIPLLLDMQPAGRFLGERFYRAGGVPSVLWELHEAGILEGNCLIPRLAGPDP